MIEVIHTDADCLLANYETKFGSYKARIGHYWHGKKDFAFLGTITRPDGSHFEWAWHKDGKSIDSADNAFDLVGFPKRYEEAFRNNATSYFHWLGKDGE